MLKGTTVILKPNAELPLDLLEAIAKDGVREFSYAAANGAVIESQFFDAADVNMIATLKELRTADNYISDTFIMHFIKSDAPVHELDHQPFEIIKDANGDLIMAFAEGDFPSFEDIDDTGHSNEYFLITEKISEDVKKAFGTCAEDLAQTMAKLSTSEFRKDLLPTLSPRGSITVISADGADPVTYAVNADGKSFDWGHTTRTHGIGEKPAEAPGPKPLSRAERVAALKNKAAGVVEPQKETSVPVVPPKEKTDTKIPDKISTMVSCPTNLSGKHARRWHEKHFGKGSIPKEADLHQPRAIANCIPSSHFAKLNTLGDIAKTQLKLLEPSKGIAQYPAIVPPGEKKTIMDRIKADQVEKYDPEKIPEIEKEFPSFSEQIATPLEELVLWTNKELKGLSSQGLMCWANQMRHALVKVQPALLKKKEVVAEVAAPVMTRAERVAAMKKKVA